MVSTAVEMINYKTITVCIILFLVGSLHNTNTRGASKNTDTGSEANIFIEGLASFIEEVDTNYPFFELKGTRKDWDSCKKNLIRRVKQCSNNNEFYGLLDEARRCLRDSHIRFSNLKGDYPQGKVRYYPGISFLPAIDNKVVIMWCADEYADKLPAGSVVTEIDGQKAHEFLEKEAEKSWKEGGYFSSPQRARIYAYRIPLEGKKNDTHKITIVKDRKPEIVTVVNKWEARGWPHTYAMPSDLKQLGNCRYGKLSGGYGYIYLRRIGSKLVEAIDAALGSFKREVFDRFDKKKGPSPGIPFYLGDIVVLIDAGTMSAGETFARDLVNCADAHLIGSRTAGSSSAKKTWQLPHELGSVVFPVRSRWGFERQPIEYNGIAPNEVVEIIPSELQNGINSGIKRAEEYLDKKWAERVASLSNSLLILAGDEQEQKEVTEKITVSRKSYEISGTVTRESGLPIRRVKISNWSPHRTSPQVTYTDNLGKFYFERNRGYVIKAEKEGFAPEFYEFRNEFYSKKQPRSRKIVINLTIAMTLTEGCTIEGVISSKEEGEPIPNAQVWVEVQDKDVSVGGSIYIIWRSDILTTDNEGRFRFIHVPDGSLRVGAEAQGFAEDSTEYYIVRDKSTEQINLKLRRKTPEEIRQEQILEEKRRDPSLSGIVTDKQGKPIEMVKISNYFPRGSNPQISYTDKDGKFYFKKHSGYVITFHKEGFAPSFYEFKDKYYKEYRLPGDWRRGRDIRGPIKIEMTLDEGGTIAGKVLSEGDNAVVSGAEVRIERPAKDTDVGQNHYIIWTGEPVKTDNDGRFIITQIPNGIVRIRVRARGFKELVYDDFTLDNRQAKTIDIRLSRLE
jgi:hypothetical protein